MIATSGFLAAFWLGLRPGPQELTAFPRPLAGFLMGPTSKGMGGKGRKRRGGEGKERIEEGKGKGMGGKRGEREGAAPLAQIPGSAPEHKQPGISKQTANK